MMQSTNTQAAASVYELDDYHTGIRIVTLLSMVGGVIIGFIGLPAIADLIGLTLPRVWVAAAGAIVTLFVLGNLVERLLRAHWPSGRQLILTSDMIELRERSQDAVTLARAQTIERSTWYFVVPRRRGTVEKGWYCAALQLRQDESAMILYAFMKPERAERLSEWASFERLHPRAAARQGDQSTAPRDPQTALREKEMLRWQSGAEMNLDDFTHFVATLSEHG